MNNISTADRANNRPFLCTEEISQSLSFNKLYLGENNIGQLVNNAHSIELVKTYILVYYKA